MDAIIASLHCSSDHAFDVEDELILTDSFGIADDDPFGFAICDLDGNDLVPFQTCHSYCIPWCPKLARLKG